MVMLEARDKKEEKEGAHDCREFGTLGRRTAVDRMQIIAELQTYDHPQSCLDWVIQAHHEPTCRN